MFPFLPLALGYYLAKSRPGSRNTGDVQTKPKPKKITEADLLSTDLQYLMQAPRALHYRPPRVKQYSLFNDPHWKRLIN